MTAVSNGIGPGNSKKERGDSGRTADGKLYGKRNHRQRDRRSSLLCRSGRRSDAGIRRSQIGAYQTLDLLDRKQQIPLVGRRTATSVATFANRRSESYVQPNPMTQIDRRRLKLAAHHHPQLPVHVASALAVLRDNDKIAFQCSRLID
jgi:hypothetical protein